LICSAASHYNGLLLIDSCML